MPSSRVSTLTARRVAERDALHFARPTHALVAPFSHLSVTSDECRKFIVSSDGVGIGPKAGGGMRRLEPASYAEAIFSKRSSLPGSARNTREKGNPGCGIVVGVLEGMGTKRVPSEL